MYVCMHVLTLVVNTGIVSITLVVIIYPGGNFLGHCYHLKLEMKKEC